ncbi:MAG: response regulator transcription factor [Phycisphaerales bacterium]|nr:response regulator transcription factor [Phycisphaerales bacterium]
MTRRRGTIVIADDHQILRDAIAQSIAKAPGLYVAECVGDAQAAINACSNVKPDILLLDIEMPGRDALGAVIDVRAVSPDTRVVILSAFCKDAMIDLSLRAGVAGYLVKSEPPSRIVDALTRVLRGESVYSASVLARIDQQRAASLKRSGDMVTRLASLTPREIEVLRYIGRGQDNAAMASHMHLSIRTVERHVSRLMHALRIDDRTRLTALAFETGLVG